jgi:hypothetical protein
MSRGPGTRGRDKDVPVDPGRRPAAAAAAVRTAAGTEADPDPGTTAGERWGSTGRRQGASVNEARQRGWTCTDALLLLLAVLLLSLLLVVLLLLGRVRLLLLLRLASSSSVVVLSEECVRWDRSNASRLGLTLAAIL